MVNNNNNNNNNKDIYIISFTYQNRKINLKICSRGKSEEVFKYLKDELTKIINERDFNNYEDNVEESEKLIKIVNNFKFGNKIVILDLIKKGANPFFINDKDNLSPFKAALTRNKCPLIDAFLYLLKLLIEKGQNQYMEQCEEIVTKVEYNDNRNGKKSKCGKNNLYHVLSNKDKMINENTWKNLIEIFKSHPLIENNEAQEIPLDILINRKKSETIQKFIFEETKKAYKGQNLKFDYADLQEYLTFKKENAKKRNSTSKSSILEEEVKETNSECVNTKPAGSFKYKNNEGEVDYNNMASTSNGSEYGIISEDLGQKRKIDCNCEQPNPKNRKLEFSEWNEVTSDTNIVPNCNNFTSENNERNTELELPFSKLNKANLTYAFGNENNICICIHYEKKNNEHVYIYKSNNDIIGSIEKVNPMNKNSSIKNNYMLNINTKNGISKFELIGYRRENIFYIKDNELIGKLDLNGNIMFDLNENMMFDLNGNMMFDLNGNMMIVRNEDFFNILRNSSQNEETIVDISEFFDFDQCCSIN